MNVYFDYLKKIGKYYVFPENINIGATTSLETNTNIVQTANGKEKRNINWLSPKKYFNASISLQNKAMIDELRNFYRAVNGKAYPFRFKDHSDFEIFIDDSILYLVKEDATSKTYRLGRKDLFDISLNVYPILNDKFKVFSNDELLEKDIHYTLDIDKATLYFKDDNKNLTNLTYQCEYHHLVRFDDDTMNVSIRTQNLFDWQSIRFAEVKEDYND